MKHVKFKGSNLLLGAPKDWDVAKQGVHVDTIHARSMVIGNTPAIMTIWVPSADEIEMMKNGHPIVLVVLGSQFPPVSLAVADDKLKPVEPPPAANDGEVTQANGTAPEGVEPASDEKPA